MNCCFFCHVYVAMLLYPCYKAGQTQLLNSTAVVLPSIYQMLAISTVYWPYTIPVQIIQVGAKQSQDIYKHSGAYLVPYI